MTKRKLREGQFLATANGGFISFSQELVICALSELRLAMKDRSPKVYRTRFNHYTPHALGSIVLLVTAFDAWLNEAIFALSFWQDADLRKAAFEPTLCKYRRVIQHCAGTSSPQKAELEMIVDLRDEIVHHLPRTISEKGKVPTWLGQADSRGLFIQSVSTAEVDFKLPQKLCSYRLAYWVWEQIDEAVTDFLSAIRVLRPKAGELEWTASNFKIYQQVLPPERLLEYDIKHGLQLDE